MHLNITNNKISLFHVTEHSVVAVFIQNLCSLTSSTRKQQLTQQACSFCFFMVNSLHAPYLFMNLLSSTDLLHNNFYPTILSGTLSI